ncbi:MAG: MerR family transcriptional regulator [Actinomycetota bacterium]|nr:MerR family transcriptional regulator [Actinomycetota bacterium]
MTQTAPRMLTIGTVCGLLKEEFPDVSISKIRYLEDQGLLTPRRTQGGYRLFAEEDVERLRTILRLQRDEFLPLRVIRQELSSPAAGKERRRRPLGLVGQEDDLDVGELCKRAAITRDLAKELEDFGLLEPRSVDGERRYAEGDAEIAAACGRLARFGIAPRHLRAFRTAADREAALLEALVAPALRSRNSERRKAGLEDLEELAQLAQELSQRLFWRDVRHIATIGT